MNTAELSARVAEKVGMTQPDAKQAVYAVIDEIAEAIIAGRKVTLSGFGTFERVRRKARMGRNPYTGEAVRVPARSVARFRLGKNFKEALNPEAARPKKRAKPKRPVKKKRKAS